MKKIFIEFNFNGFGFTSVFNLKQTTINETISFSNGDISFQDTILTFN